MAAGGPAPGRLTTGASRALKPLAATLLERRRARRMVNATVEALPWPGRTLAYRVLGRALYGSPPSRVQRGDWRVNAYGRNLRIPLEGDDVALRVEFALGLLGHDAEVKRLYERMLRSEAPPRTFYDVGANFGTHSLPFLAHGVRTLSFEPNPACHELFLELCSANGLSPELHGVAVGESGGVATLSYPTDATWLGTTSEDVREELGSTAEVRSFRVPQTSLDELAASGAPAPDVLKIDTEGNELAVLRGAVRVLAEARPVVVLEALPEGPRAGLFDFLDARGYRLSAAPGGAALDRAGFVSSLGTNFLAEPSAS